MIIKKITEGYVIQDYDTGLGVFIKQEFAAGAGVFYEDCDNNPIKLLPNEVEAIPYLPFDMKQPRNRKF